MLAHREGAHGIHHNAARAHVLYQTSTMAALLDGIYDGNVTIAELLQHGDFGVGTFNHLDGEMVVNDGVCHHLYASGEARVADPDELTPFAAVTTFEPDMRFAVATPTTRGALLAQIDARLSSENLFHAIRTVGDFSTVSTRTASRQEAPYQPLAKATDEQAVRTFTGTGGVLVGFRTPDYEQGIAVSGYHLHFLNAPGTGGGHAFDFVLERGVVEICTVSEMRLSLPTSGPFLGADLHTKQLDEDIRKSEG
jgi:acetolactate decarboxylase